jgi:hypothetical protein
MSNLTTATDHAEVQDLLDRLDNLGVTVREGRRRLIVRGQPGFEHDTAVQALVARLRARHASEPDAVLALVRQRDAR